MKYNFSERLKFSQGKKIKTDQEIIKQAIPFCESVIKTDEVTDKSGIDYIAKLQGGAEIGIDVKTREQGCSRFWKYEEPELVLEIWSIYPDRKNKGKRGWTLSERTNVDLILYTFNEKDSSKYYLLPFQHLRKAFITNGKDWVKKYEKKFQYSETWKSEAVFVPASVVLGAIMQEMQGENNMPV